MSLSITVDLGAATPPLERIRRQVASLIAVGSLAPGEHLPTVRALASDLGVANGTVNRAYKELESAGLVESRRRRGTVVSARAGQFAAGEADLDDETTIDLVRGHLRAGPPPGG